MDIHLEAIHFLHIEFLYSQRKGDFAGEVDGVRLCLLIVYLSGAYATPGHGDYRAVHHIGIGYLGHDLADVGAFAEGVGVEYYSALQIYRKIGRVKSRIPGVGGK